MFKSCFQLDKKYSYPLPRENPDKLNFKGGDFFYQKYNADTLDCTYAFGVDPVWGMSSQRLSLSNNIKMKLSVIYGVIHMTFGVLHKGANTWYHKDWIGFVFEVCTGLLILLPLFGWMDVLIYGKWMFSAYPYENFQNLNDATLYIKKNQTTGATLAVDYVSDLVNRKAPGVINILITTVFQMGKPTEDGGAYLWSYGDYKVWSTKARNNQTEFNMPN
jgi:vacuolar-type H+-ATPase subunit I/STV1